MQSPVKRQVLKGVAIATLIGAPALILPSAADAAVVQHSATGVRIASGAPASVQFAAGDAAVGANLLSNTDTTSATGSTTATLRGPKDVLIKLAIKAIKKVPGLWSAAVRAAKAGYKAFAKWVKRLPGVVKRAIETAGISAVYDWIKEHVLHTK